jgi:exodeoxyribonuclease-5
MQLTTEQKDVLRKIVKDLDNNQIQTLGGFAGTGKTTLIRTLAKMKPMFACAAYTGKAANVMRKKGLGGASTIHSYIYRPFQDKDGQTVWNLASKYDPWLERIGGFIIDEASMVNQEIDADLRSFGLPIIYVGDHGQLEPVGGTKFNLMAKPMHRLEEVHRNAGEIAHFAQHLRTGGVPRKFAGTKSVQIIGEKAVQPRHLASTDQVICAYNRTRVKINEQVRAEKKINFAYISVGDKIMCLRNNRRERLFNGMQGVVTRVWTLEESGGDEDKFYFDFVCDGEKFEKIRYDPEQFGRETNDFNFTQSANPFDYAYAITCHKAQGDEWDNVIVYEQVCDKWDHRRWAYTAASRAKRGLIWIESARYIPSYLA